jgi:hypothetical protein
MLIMMDYVEKFQVKKHANILVILVILRLTVFVNLVWEIIEMRIVRLVSVLLDILIIVLFVKNVLRTV